MPALLTLVPWVSRNLRPYPSASSGIFVYTLPRSSTMMWKMLCSTHHLSTDLPSISGFTLEGVGGIILGAVARSQALPLLPQLSRGLVESEREHASLIPKHACTHCQTQPISHPPGLPGQTKLPDSLNSSSFQEARDVLGFPPGSLLGSCLC